ncbi:MAG: SIS domain-containing protein [Planctomycetaceae bacterium]
MGDTLEEIESQPAVWRQAVARVTPESNLMLPYARERVAAVGCGTSWFVAQSYAARREELGFGESDAFTPTEMPPYRIYDRVVAISRSGTTTEVIRFIERMREQAVLTTAITAVAGSPVAELAGHTIVLDFADERSIVQTRFATSALALLRAHLLEELEPVIADGERALADPLPIEPAEFEHYVFLGGGWSVGLANEAALKLREAAQAWTESYPAMEYRHGPISVAGPRSVVWALGEVDRGVLDAAAATGATVVGGTLDPMAELVQIQRTAVALARARGLDPDHPRHLARSVVLS